MDLWFSALLGLVQGLTEFLPISSTAHLRVVPALLGQADPGAAFSAVIQLGTLAAVLVYFSRDLFVDMPRAVLRDRSAPQARWPLYLVLGTIPVAVCGLSLKRYIEGDFRSLYVVASALIVVALIMWAADRAGARNRSAEAVTAVDALIIGGAQALALIPGVSRSGSTMAAALFLGLTRPEAARFSFLLGIPAIGAAGLYELRGALDAMGDEAWAPIAVGTAVAAVSGYASIAWLLRFLGRHSFTPFVAYRIALGALLLALCALGVVSPL